MHKTIQLQDTATVKNSIRRSPWRNAFLLIALAASAALAPVGLRAAPGDIFVSVNGNTQDGGGFVYKYTPTGVQSTFASGLSRPRGVAFDSIGNLFVANTTFDGTTYQATIVKITPRGVQSTFATLSSNFWAEGLAFDSSGSLFVAAGDTNDPNLGSTIFKFTPDGTQSTFGSVPSVIIGLAFDSAGNLCVPDFGGGVFQAIWKFTPDGTKSVFVGPCAFCALPPASGPDGLASDRFGNLFVSTHSSPPVLDGDAILKFTPEGVGSTFATGLNYPRGLAFDRSGNLFVAEIRQDGPGDILKFTPDGNMTVFASGIGPGANGGPEFLAIQPRRH